MSRFSGILAVLTVFGLSVCAGQEPAGTSVEKEIPRYTEVTPRIGAAGQPTEAGFRLLASKGYKAVINLRTDKEGVDLAAEEKLVRSLGLQYYNIPVVGADLQEAQATEFLKLMDELRDEKVVLHCASANRVGAFLMIYRALDDGLTPEQAEAEARKVGLRSESLAKFAHEVISKQKAK
jgi:protein tyrosine phosphatase (PTP) superfamily phosphohydrolase (DUF442 family)